jgi:hypothetical protein
MIHFPIIIFIPISYRPITQYNHFSYVLEFLNAPNQVLGEYALNINNASSKVVYANYAETCASLAPNYYKDPDC